MLETDGYFNALQEKITTKTAVIAVIGLGYVGLPLAKGFASRGYAVYGIEEQQDKVDALLAGRDYVEPALQDLAGLLNKLSPTTDFAVIGSSDVIVICVPTPLSRNLEPDVSYVEKVSYIIGQHIRPGSLVILESTTYPGTTNEIVLPALEAGGRVSEVGGDYFLAFSPERVDPGNPHYNTSNTTKVLGGADGRSAAVTRLVYENLLGDANLVKVASSTRAAEMEKLFENIFRSVNIALVNELSLLCRAMDLDVWEIIELASTKPYGFMPFYPGPGIGGHCIPLDPFYLTWKAREFDFRTRFIELAGELNDRMPRHVVDLVGEILGEKGLRGAQVLLVGAAYKPNIGDYRESPSLRVFDYLDARGAVVSYFDPLAPEIKLRDGRKVQSVTSSALGHEHYDVVVLLTVHDVMDLTVLCHLATRVVDTRGVTRGRDFDAEILVLGRGSGHVSV